MPPKNAKTKEPVHQDSGFSAACHCTLPHWDYAQILQENWGAALAATGAAGAGTGAAARPTKGQKDTVFGSSFTDAEGREVLEAFVKSYSDAANTAVHEKRSPDVPLTNHPTFGDSATPASATADCAQHSTADAGDGTDASAQSFKVTWQRPAEVVKPFRPVVHRNPTPFLNPYATPELLLPIDEKVEVARHRAESIIAQGTSTGKQRGDQSQRDAAAVGPLHQQYPEAVSLMADLVGQDASMWQGLSTDEAVRRYREVPALMQPYDPTLLQGCSETPAEACGSRYSTALRHKLQQVEVLTALSSIPPFLMSAFNSALLAVEQAQHLVGPGQYLWELIHPHAPGTCHPVYNPFGKYAVKLYVEGAYRKVLVDDALPVDDLGRPLLTVTSRKELWPAILAKAVLKVFGSSATRVLLEEPDLVVTCLLGNWVPQYVPAKQDGVALTAVLLSCKRHLPNRRIVAGKGNDGMEQGERASEVAAASLGVPELHPASSLAPSQPEAAEQEEREKKKPGSSAGRKAARRQSRKSISGTGAQGQSVAAAAAEVATVEPQNPGDVPEADDDAVQDSWPLLVCGLRTSELAGGPGLGTGTQLYSIAAITPFRNTLALQVRTSPCTDLCEGIFHRERDRKDVRDLVVSTSLGQKSALQVEKQLSQTDCWLTLEELAEEMTSLVVWRCFDGRYIHQAAMDFGAVPVAPVPVPAVASKKNAAAAAAATAANAAAQAAVMRLPKKHTTMWWSVSSARTTEVSIVVHAAHPPPPLTPEEEAAATAPAQPPAVMAAPKKLSVAKPSKGKKAGGNDDTAAAPAPVDGRQQQMQLPLIIEEALKSTTSTGFHSSRVCVGAAPVLDTKTLQLDCYTWDRADPLTRSLTITYMYGKLCGTVMQLPAGTNLFRVTAPEMEVGDKVTFLSNAQMELKSELLDVAKTANLFTLSDADTYPAVERPEEERVWFKRKLKVSEPTRITAVLSTLLPGEDVTAHRLLLASPAHAKGQKNVGNNGRGAGGGAGGGAGAGGKQQSNGANGKEQSGLDLVLCTVPILRYTRLLLIDLDGNTPTLIGEMGKLVQLTLTPNEKGYVLVAYTKVPLSDVAMLRSAVSPCLSSPIQSTDMSLAIYPKGLWKVVVRSDHELAAFEWIAHGANTISDSGVLERGGAASLFKQTCTLAESTHLSIIADLTESTAIPFTVRVSCLSVGGATGAGQVPLAASKATVSDTVSGVTTADSIIQPDGAVGGPHYKVVCDTGEQQRHIFVPDVLLEVPEKAKNAVYLIEGFIPEDCKTEWIERCRELQELKFLTMRSSAETSADRRRIEDTRAYQEDPAGFLALKLQEQAQAQAQQQATEHVDRGARDGTLSSAQRRRRSVDRKKFSGSGAVRSGSSAENSACLPDTAALFGRMGSPSVRGSVQAASLDTGATDVVIAYQLQLQLSNTRAELRQSMPPNDCLASLRAQWRDTVTYLRDKTAANTLRDGGGLATVGSASAAHSRTAGGGGGGAAAGGGGNAAGASGKGSKHNKESVAILESVLRTEQGKQSRMRFLENPKNVLVPFLQSSDDAAPASGKDNSRTSIRGGGADSARHTSVGNPQIIAEDSEENNYRHTEPLPPERYSVKWLPIRAVEVCPPTSADAQAGVATAAAAAAAAAAARDGKQRGRVAGKQSSIVPASALANGTAAVTPLANYSSLEDHEALAALRAPLNTYSERFYDACREQREVQRRERKPIKSILYAYWEQQAATAAANASRELADKSDGAGAAAAPPSPPVTNVASAAVLPLTFTSIIGTKEDDSLAGKPRRSVPEYAGT